VSENSSLSFDGVANNFVLKKEIFKFMYEVYSILGSLTGLSPEPRSTWWGGGERGGRIRSGVSCPFLSLVRRVTAL
jgi:hypothetical protein